MTATSPTPPPEPKFEPEREFGSRTEPFTEANLAKARKTLEKFQKMHWLADYPCERADGGHKAPCLPVDDVEWLFGYIDALTERANFWQMTHEEATEVAGEKIASLTAQVESLTTERDEYRTACVYERDHKLQAISERNAAVIERDKARGVVEAAKKWAAAHSAAFHDLIPREFLALTGAERRRAFQEHDAYGENRTHDVVVATRDLYLALAAIATFDAKPTDSEDGS